jgi:hypothetical protein
VHNIKMDLGGMRWSCFEMDWFLRFEFLWRDVTLCGSCKNRNFGGT